MNYRIQIIKKNILTHIILHRKLNMSISALLLFIVHNCDLLLYSVTFIFSNANCVRKYKGDGVYSQSALCHFKL